MRLSPAVRAYLAFTAAFAVLAGLVFWGTWSLDVVPVMPDAQTSYPLDFASRQWHAVLANGKLIPSQLTFFIGSPYFWQELQYVIAIYAAGLGMAYFCRGRGLSRLAAYGAGLLLAFCGYWLTLFSAGHLGWFYWMTYGVFAFGLADRAVRLGRLRHWLLLGLTVAWAGFNQQDLWLLFTVFTAFYFVWCCVCERKFPWRGALLALVTFLLVSLPNLVDTYRTTIAGRERQIGQYAAAKTQKTGATQAARAGAPGAEDADRAEAVRWEFVTNWSLPPADTLEFVNARVHGDTSCPYVLSVNKPDTRPYTGELGRQLGEPTGNYRQHSLYVGWMTCLFAVCGLVFGRRQRDVWFFLAAALVFYALSLGRYFEPCYRLIFALPAGDLIRCPVKWHHLTEFCLVVLAGYGIHGLSVWLANVFPKGGQFVVLGAVLLGALNLAVEAHRFCAPVNVQNARKLGREAKLTLIPRDYFRHPSFVEMMRRGEVVVLADFHADSRLVVAEVVERFDRHEPKPTSGKTLLLGGVSLLAALAVLALSFVDRRRKPSWEEFL